jgi:hypothetical protein
MSSIAYTVQPLSAEFSSRVRKQGLDDQQQAVEYHIAQGGEPCRDVLRRAMPGERLILASHCPFRRAGPYREYGPVFMLADSEPPPVLTALPITGEMPYLGQQFVLRAYSVDERIVDAAVVTAADAEAQLQVFLAREDVDTVFVRFAAYGCYACRVVRPIRSASYR